MTDYHASMRQNLSKGILNKQTKQEHFPFVKPLLKYSNQPVDGTSAAECPSFHFLPTGEVLVS